MGTERSLEVIDSDGHVMEPPTMWQEYGDPAFRDRLPRVVTGAGGELVGYGELAAGLEMHCLPLAAAQGDQASAEKAQEWDEASKHKMAATGGWDPRARLADMDGEGIDLAVLYPTHLLRVPSDPVLHDAACRAYNRWLADYCSADPHRLVGTAVVPLGDVSLAVRELRRCVAEHGFKAVMIRPAPYVGLLKLHHPVYDPFWAEVQDLDLALGVHPAPFPDLPNVCQGLRLDETGYAGADLFLKQGLTNALDMMVALGWFVGGGICERFPRLRVAVLEGSGGWAPTMLERFEHHFRIFGSERQRSSPSELFARQCWISFDPDEVALPFTVEQLGAERVVWASDYPHPDAKFPGVVEELRDAVKPLGDRERELVLGGSARALYRI